MGAMLNNQEVKSPFNLALPLIQAIFFLVENHLCGKNGIKKHPAKAGCRFS